MPGPLPELVEETSAFHTINVVMQVKGVLFFTSVYDVFYYWWLTLEAMWSMYDDQSTVGRFNYSRLQHMESQGPSWEIQEAEDNTLFSVFTDTLRFTVRHDLLGTRVI